ncbi:glycosyltransferase family 4 protein [Mucilaginibacter robiniae]|uniref:Glycosyltransferase family 4 protein n=1 Tax=Mucilaginibacter robiniae TaxID=2728022 RepID=A0A7L5E2G8_9SPHI|nr:glycosyltransferase family 1 protein [Mucilaginibacter robiniae]QJD97570.1 glycosyltransferase family 4 protein [Mucilaginibacter robiniae]
MPKPLIIGIDIRDLHVAKTGTQTYLAELCAAFKALQSSEVQFKFLDSNFPVYTGKNKALKWIEHFKYQLWKQVLLPLKAWMNSCDIVFCTDNFVPIMHLGYQTIPVFHDAFFFESPEQYGKLWLWLYKKTALPAARRSPFIITPSAHAQKQIHHFTQISNQQLIVVPEGPKTLSHPPTSTGHEQVLNQYALSPGNYLLHVGSMFKRKNIPALIQAFGILKEQGYPDLKLALAGPLTSSNTENDYQLILDAIESSVFKQDIIVTGYLSNDELSQLYRSALLYVFPSVNEGFGIPVLEAFNFNLPVLVANNTSLPEVGGNAVLTFSPFDVNDIAMQIQRVLEDADLRKTMIVKGQERLKEFSWQKTALQLIEVFKKAAYLQ